MSRLCKSKSICPKFKLGKNIYFWRNILKSFSGPNIFCISSDVLLPMAIHTVNRIQVRRLSFIMRNTLKRILAPGVNGTRGTYIKINTLSVSKQYSFSFFLI